MEKYQLDFIDRVRYHWLLRNVILSPDILDFIACQFALESNFGTSVLCNNQNNFCGMKIPHSRVFYGVRSEFAKNFEFATYDSFDSCVLDYCSWLFYNRPFQNNLEHLDSFIYFLRHSGYCPEMDYISKIQSIYSQLKSYQNGKSN